MTLQSCGKGWRAAPTYCDEKTDANQIFYWDDDLFGHMR
jgi:hypothetical protein